MQIFADRYNEDSSPGCGGDDREDAEEDPVGRSRRARFGVTSARLLEDCFGVLDLDSEASPG